MKKVLFHSLVGLVLMVSSLECSHAMADERARYTYPPKHEGVYVVAHRGVHNGIPENTLAAYQKAIDLGCDFIEIDVRTSKDGEYVSIHNSTVDAYVEGITGKVEDFTFVELRAMDIGIKHGEQWKGTKIPTFEEILQLCQGKIGIYLDLKNAPVKPLMNLSKQYNMEDRVIWYCDPEEHDEVERLSKQCVSMPDPGPEENLQQIIDQFEPTLVASVWRYYSESFVKTCHEAGAMVIVDESDQSCWVDAIAWGSDGIQTDHPAELIEYLKNYRPQYSKSPNNGGVYVSAHRGVHNGIPENTLAAYQKAIDLGCDFVEIDVRTTQDGHFVSIHNSTIDAYVDGQTAKVEEMTLDELRALDIGIKHGVQWAGTQIPTFEEILALCKDSIGVYIDLKNASVEGLMPIIKAYDMEDQVLWYAHADEMDKIRQLSSRCVSTPNPKSQEDVSAVVKRFNATFLTTFRGQHSEAMVKACHENGVIVLADDRGKESWADYIAWGTDGIQTDYPEELIALLKTRDKE
jgi:glycerophosphoryl diester phosphodiesterase